MVNLKILLGSLHRRLRPLKPVEGSTYCYSCPWWSLGLAAAHSSPTACSWHGAQPSPSSHNCTNSSASRCPHLLLPNPVKTRPVNMLQAQVSKHYNPHNATRFPHESPDNTLARGKAAEGTRLLHLPEQGVRKISNLIQKQMQIQNTSKTAKRQKQILLCYKPSPSQ